MLWVLLASDSSYVEVSGVWDWGDILIRRIYREGERKDGVGWPWIEFVDRQTGRILFKSYMYDETLRVSLPLDVYLRDFDGDGMDEALLTFTTGGSACCFESYLFDRNWHDFRAVLKLEGPILKRIEDIDGDGDLELIFLDDIWYPYLSNADQAMYYLVYSYDEERRRWGCSRRMTIELNSQHLWSGEKISPPGKTGWGDFPVYPYEYQNMNFLIFSGRLAQARKYFMGRYRGEDPERVWREVLEIASSHPGFGCVYPHFRVGD